MTDREIQSRKQDHLSVIFSKEIAFERSNLLDCVQLEHCALPEMNLEDVDTSVEFFGKRLKAPLMITSMTGGAERSQIWNQNFARIANKYGIAFAVGSQRVMVNHPEIRDHFAVRELMPKGVLLGNIGAQQLVEYSPDRVRSLVDGIEADGLCIHLNPAHELAQGGGERNFSAHLDAIARTVELLDGRVLVKETGCGIAPELCQRLAGVGVKYIDVAGVGGTSWPKVERHRKSKHLDKAIAWTFGEWGLPTAYCTIGARRLCGDSLRLVASGGLQDGLDIARAIAAGADIAGFARAVLNLGTQIEDSGRCLPIEDTIHELKVAMLLTGCRNLAQLRGVRRVYTGELHEWLARRGWLSDAVTE